jgi:mono/diheme cytochrome c family protein
MSSANGSGDGQVGDGGVPESSVSALNGMPCEVGALLSQYCLACHGSSPAGGAHKALSSISDLNAPYGGGLTLAEEALARMRSSTSERMPPSGSRPSENEIAAFEAWVNAGQPESACDSDAGAAQPDLAFSGGVVCTSNEYWTSGDHESPLMHPGRACIDCHTREDEGPNLTIAGTVFPTGHEPDDCNGASGQTEDIRIEVTDANGNVESLTPNRAGNFDSRGRLSFPITARVLYQGRVRAMLTPVDSGDCNSCHTTNGKESAPGRIALP